jgi:AraC-like DNA-binding protein
MLLPVFDSWDCKRPAVPPRSRLYPLEPIGVGTPLVESLTGYVARLAEAYATRVADLVGLVLAEYAPPGAPIISWRTKRTRAGTGFRPGTSAINGVTDEARRWILATEAATCRSDLRFLTLFTLRQVFCNQRLLRFIQAWCPHCLEEWRQCGQTIYHPLAWNLRHVTVCARHWSNLREVCPYCHCSFGPLLAKTRPGYCPRCSQWLGISQAIGPTHVRHTGSTERLRWSANAWGDLLALIPRAETQPLCETFQKNLARLVEQLAEGKAKRFSALMRRSAQNLCSGDAQEQGGENTLLAWRATGSWLSGKRMPRPDLLIEFCYTFRVTPSDLLLDTQLEWAIDSKLKREAALANRGSHIIPPEHMRNVLRAALTETPPPTLHEVARRVGYRTNVTLRRLDRDSCDRIVENSRKLRKSSVNKWTVHGRPCEREEIAEILKAYLAQDKPAPLSQIASQLGCHSLTRLEVHFSELCKAIVAKRNQNREQERGAVRRGLIAAAKEDPPPTTADLTLRLHCSERALRTGFPDLFSAVVKSRKAWRVRQREHTHARVSKLANEMLGASVPSICKSAGIAIKFLRYRFPDLYRQIGSKCIEQREASRRLRRERLRTEIDRVLAELSCQGVAPTLRRVTALLSPEAARDWKLIRQAFDDAQRNLGIGPNQVIQDQPEDRTPHQLLLD